MAQEAAKNKPISDAAVKKLLAMVNTIGTKDPGSEERKSYLLARLKSATIYHGLPQIFITLNPADNVSPIALFYAGERIDVKSFYPQLYTAGHRLKTMLDNPLSVVEYFRNTINTILKTMLKGGMFGELIHYHGPIEYQGRGTPHAHLVVCPSPPCHVLHYSKWLAMDKRRWISSLAPRKSAEGSRLP
jgi:hypothetical protein